MVGKKVSAGLACNNVPCGCRSDGDDDVWIASDHRCLPSETVLAAELLLLLLLMMMMMMMTTAIP